MTIKTVLLTGVTGYLGRHLLPMLLQENFECVGLIRKRSALERIANFKDKITFCENDSTSLETLFKKKNVDIIIHTATSYGRKNETVNEMLDVNLILPLKLLTLAHRYSSSLFMNTDTVLLPHTNPYALSKAQVCDWGKILSKTGKLKFLNFKMQHMYGSGDDESKFTSFIVKSCLRNETEIGLSEGSQKRDFIYINDIISAYQHILKIPTDTFLAFEEFELGSGIATPIKEYALLAHQLTHSTSQLKFGAKPQRSHEENYVANIEKLKKLGWAPQFTLQQGLQETIKMEKKNCAI